MIFGDSNMLQPSHNTVPGNHKISNLMKNIKYIFYITIPHSTIHHFHPKFQSFGPVIDISSPHPIIYIHFFVTISPSIILIINLFLILILITTINHPPSNIPSHPPSNIQSTIHHSIHVIHTYK